MSAYSEVVELCCAMVGVPSISPQDRVEFESPYGEHDMAVFVADWFKQQGLDAEIQEVLPGRENVFALAKGKDSSRTVVLCSHMDTVDVQGMVVEPYKAKVEDGKLYGRGSVDDKGPLAAMMIAFRDRVKAGDLPCNLALAATCGEEYDMEGSAYCARQLGSSIHGVILGEPTEHEVVVAHKGVIRLAVTCLGQSGHSSMPDRSVNAVYLMGRAICAIEEFALATSGRKGHELLGAETLSATIVNGGQQINVIPDRCELQIDWRSLPGRTAEHCRDELAAVLGDVLKPEQFEIKILKEFVSMETDAESAFVKAVVDGVESQGVETKVVVKPYATDASSFVDLKVPTPVVGPGKAVQAHTKDEYIEVAELEQGLAVYKAILSQPGIFS